MVLANTNTLLYNTGGNMQKELYVVEFSSANYAGAPEYCRVWAFSEEDALDAASEYAHEFYYEQDAEQWYEENNLDQYETEEHPGGWASMDRAFLQAGSRHEEFIADPEQAASFYPIVN